MEFKILTDSLLDKFLKSFETSVLEKLSAQEKEALPVDYFQFYKSVSSVYSSKIEGEEIDFDSYFKHKFLKVKFKPDYTRKADDLYKAYDFIDAAELNFNYVLKAHSILTSAILSRSEQGKIRNNPMFVINSDDKIEYVAASPEIVKNETEKLFDDIKLLGDIELSEAEMFYYAALIHLVFLKIHPFQDGNGRTARLIEKWFLMEKIGPRATAIQLEKNYCNLLDKYYQNIRKIGLDYESLDYSKSLDFLLMTVKMLMD
jgi:Fic family protein